MVFTLVRFFAGQKIFSQLQWGRTSNAYGLGALYIKVH